MRRQLTILLLCLSISISALAQMSTPTPTRETLAQGQLDVLLQSQQAIAAAEQAGAASYATALLEDARWRFQFAQTNWNSDTRTKREAARMRANEALAAAYAAIAKSRWLSNNSAARALQADIVSFGGTSPSYTFVDEKPDLVWTRGEDSRQRIAYARSIVEQADAIGAWKIAGTDLKTAEQNLATAKRITTNDRNNESADFLAYMAEMEARRAFYLARLANAERDLGPLQLERTRLAQLASARRMAEERAAQERQQAAELDLNRRLEEERAARVAAEQRLDTLVKQYETAVANAAPSDVDALRRQVEDQQIALRAIMERGRLSDDMLTAEIQGLRSELDRSRSTLSADVVAQREAAIRQREEELQRLQRERTDLAAHREELDRRQLAEIDAARQRRAELEQQAEEMRRQVAAAQQAAEEARLSAERSATETRQNMQQTQAEVEKLRSQLSSSEAETRRLRMQQELAGIAKTRTDERGLIVTIPGIFFDVGKSQLKPGARSTLTKIAEELRRSDAAAVAIEGHTDSTGPAEKNQQLSEARASAVRDFLVGAGVPASRVSAVGKGEDSPVATNKSTAGRQQNRRVELVIHE
jgi:outer membrane protein OmpA-like peptidoglycan-associated protein